MLLLDKRLDRAWLALLGLVTLSACPQRPLEGDSDSADASSGTTSTSGTTTTTTTATETATATTEPTTGPPPECQVDDDCGDFCSYCFDGVCSYSPGCCDYAVPGDRWYPRCSPPIDCYYGYECPEGYECTFDGCVPVVPEVLPACPGAPPELSQWNLGAVPGAFALADLDGDGDLDLAAAQPSLARIELAFNDGAGMFTPGDTVELGGPMTGLDVVAGDVDGDGDVDLVAVQPGAPEGLILIFGQDAKFTPQPPLPSTPDAAFIGAFNGDSAPDILMRHPGIPGVLVRLGDGMGGFSPEQDVGIAGSVGEEASVLDLDGDGLDDLLGQQPGEDGLELRAFGGTADGTFVLHASLLVGEVPHAQVLGVDLDAAVAPELVGIRGEPEGGTVQVWTAIGVNAWNAPAKSVKTTSPLLGGVIADFSGDGVPDLVSATGQPQLAVLVGDGAGFFACEAILPVPAGTEAKLVAAGDVDGDGRVDLVAGNPGDPVVAVLRGN